jgi:hypothetical protein
LRDVANVRDGFAPQTNIVRLDGRRGALVTVLKSGGASTLDVVQGVRNMLPRVASTLPPQLKIRPLADQSVFVRGAVNSVIREAVIAACLTALMILIFLGSWRSTLMCQFPFRSILTSILVELPARDQCRGSRRASACRQHPRERRHGDRKCESKSDPGIRQAILVAPSNRDPALSPRFAFRLSSSRCSSAGRGTLSFRSLGGGGGLRA